jgi:hypothetical protein
MAAPELSRHFRKVALARQTTGDALEAVDQSGKLHGGWILDRQMDMVILSDPADADVQGGLVRRGSLP